MNYYKKILGGLLLAAVGDAMGAATETRSTEQIIEKFGGLVKEFKDIPDDVFAAGFPKGSVTDDFSLAYYTAVAIVNNHGVINEKTANDALLAWSKTPFYKMAGPTTRAAVDKIKGLEVPPAPFNLAVDNSKGSNGSAMKIAPVGLFAKGDIDKAMTDAVVICKPTHNNSASLSAACAVAAAVAAAMQEDATIDSIVEAGLKGALYGEQHGVKLACPSVYKRIILAVKLGKRYQGDTMKAMKEIGDIIGSGLAAAEAVPAAFGLLVACDADPLETVIAGVNIGNDTDTVATIAGAIAGTYRSYYDAKLLEIIENVNGFNMRTLARVLGEMTGV